MPIEQQLIVYLFTTLGSSFGIAFGGGSFVVLPVLFLLGVDPKIAVATNVVAAIAQLITGATIFSRHKKIHYEVAAYTTPFYLIGGIIGAFALIKVNPDLIKNIVAIAIIFFAIFGLFGERALAGGECKPAKHKTILAYPLLLLVGIYQVMTTAGAGTLLTFILIYLFGMRLKCTIYTRQFITLPTMIVGASILVYSGMVDWLLFIPLVLGRVTGAIIGSEVVMHTKSKKLAIVFSIIVILMAIKTLLS
jgi:uncharacterized membrane protein YfcA